MMHTAARARHGGPEKAIATLVTVVLISLFAVLVGRFAGPPRGEGPPPAAQPPTFGSDTEPSREAADDSQVARGARYESDLEPEGEAAEADWLEFQACPDGDERARAEPAGAKIARTPAEARGEADLRPAIDEADREALLAAARAASEPLQQASSTRPPPTKAAPRQARTLRVQSESLPSAILGGRVLEAGGGPIPGADIRLLCGSRTWSEVRTDFQGEFILADLCPGRYRLVASAPGFLDGAFAESLDLAPGEARFGVDVWLARGGSIAGRVLDDRGLPVEGASLAVAGAPGAVARSSVDGYYRIDGAPPGRIRLRASHPDFLEPPLRPVDLPRLEDGTPGLVENIDFVLCGGASIEGALLGPEGLAEQANVTLRDQSGRALVRAAAGARGAFRFQGLRAGTYQILATGRNGAILAHDLFPLATGERRVLDLMLFAGGTLAGVVLDSRQEPVASARVSAEAIGAGYAQGGITDAAGRFVISNLFDATYSVSVRPPEFLAVPEPILVDVVGAAGPLDVSFTVEPGGILVGTVTAPDGGPGAGSSIAVFDVAARQVARGEADPLGRFRIPGLPASELQIYARLGRNVARLPARLFGGEEHRVALVLAPAARISGSAIFPDGRPAPGASVEACSEDNVVRRCARARTDGRFEIHDLFWGTYTVSATLGRFCGRTALHVAESQHVTGLLVVLR